jgi:hypothetical protein
VQTFAIIRFLFGRALRPYDPADMSIGWTYSPPQSAFMKLMLPRPFQKRDQEKHWSVRTDTIRIRRCAPPDARARP